MVIHSLGGINVDNLITCRWWCWRSRTVLLSLSQQYLLSDKEQVPFLFNWDQFWWLVVVDVEALVFVLVLAVPSDKEQLPFWFSSLLYVECGTGCMGNRTTRIIFSNFEIQYVPQKTQGFAFCILLDIFYGTSYALMDFFISTAFSLKRIFAQSTSEFLTRERENLGGQICLNTEMTFS